LKVVQANYVNYKTVVRRGGSRQNCSARISESG